MGELCDYCQRLNLDQPTRPQQAYSLGTRQRFQDSATKQRTCPFCELVWKASRFEYTAWDALVGLTWTPDGFIPGMIDEPVKHFGDELIVPMLANDATVKSPMAHAKTIQRQVGAATLSKWLTLCNGGASGNHTDCQNRSIWQKGRAASSLSGLSHFRLVNVHDNCVYDFKPQDGIKAYAALSYVIGDVRLPSYYQKNFDDFNKRPGLDVSRLPRTYQDAFKVVQMLGLDYLWVDALCLIGEPENSEDKREGIANMDRIYEGAMVTIIAADHSDANGGITALHQRNTSDYQTCMTIPSGHQWGLVTGVNRRLHISTEKYPTRGWTYQELILSHRCLIFINGLAFFRCRARMYSEETFWDDHDDEAPSDGIKTSPYQLDFIPRSLEDPWCTYIDTLWRYRIRQLGRDEDTINGFRGILNRVTDSLNTSDLEGLPQSILDMALIWYHRPDSNLGRTTQRLNWPSWTWAGWKGGVINSFLHRADGNANDRSDWVNNINGHIEYWYTDSDGTNLRQADTGFPFQDKPPTPAFPLGVRRRILQLRTSVTTHAVVTFGRWGVGDIRTNTNKLVGIVYPDDLRGDSSLGYTLAMLSRAPNGDVNFDFGLYFPDEHGLMEDGDGADSRTARASISAKAHDLRWVLLLVWDARGFYQRRGLGFVHTEKVSLLPWKSDKEWIALG